MKHPSSEMLTDFLYEELDPARQSQVSAHLSECAECRAQVDAWRGVRRELKGWTLPATNRPTTVRARSLGVIRWAAAAAIFVGTGFALAKITQRPIDLEPLRQELAQDIRHDVSRDLSVQVVQALRDEVAKELTTKFAHYRAEQNEQQQEFQQALIQALSRVEARQLVQHADLRKDVEIIAVRAQQELDRLAVNDQADTPGVEIQP